LPLYPHFLPAFFFPVFLLEKVLRSASVAGLSQMETLEGDTNRLYHLKFKIMNIIGRVTRDAEVRSLSEDKKVVNFSIAVNDSYKPKNGEKVTHTEFFDCSYWLATGIAQYLTKGSIVELTGRLSSRAYLDSEGNPKAGLNFHTAAITLHGGNSGKPQEGAKQQTQPQQATKAATTAKTEDTQVYEAEVLPNAAAADDDLPF